MIRPIWLVRGSPPQLVDDLLNGIEAMHHEVITQHPPTFCFAALYPDVDHDKRLMQKAVTNDPAVKPALVLAISS
jgi:hypothetical protein